LVWPIVQQGMNERFAGASAGTAFGDVSVFCTPTCVRSFDCACVHRHLYHSGKDLYHSVKVVWVQGRMRFDVGWVQGSYFADDAGKIDQYVVEDQRYNAASPLHQVLTVSSLQPPRLLSHIRFCSAADAGRRTVSHQSLQ